MKNTKNKDPVVVCCLNKIHNLESIFRFHENAVYENEYKPFKITFEMSSLFETLKTELSGEIEYEYVAWNIKVSFSYMH